jgi:hypothetical protein
MNTRIIDLSSIPEYTGRMCNKSMFTNPDNFYKKTRIELCTQEHKSGKSSVHISSVQTDNFMICMICGIPVSPYNKQNIMPFTQSTCVHLNCYFYTHKTYCFICGYQITPYSRKRTSIYGKVYHQGCLNTTHKKSKL